MIAHNHPGGSVIPSTDDEELTKKILHLLNLTGYKLCDHLIFNDAGECYSFEQNGIFARWKGEPLY